MAVRLLRAGAPVGPWPSDPSEDASGYTSPDLPQGQFKLTQGNYSVDQNPQHPGQRQIAYWPDGNGGNDSVKHFQNSW